MDVTRAQRLNRIFASALSDSSKLTNTDLFLESVCEQPDPVSCIHKIVTSKDGLKSFQKAMVRNLSLEFINGRATQVLSYLQSPELAEVGDGKFLRQVVMKIADPPILWNEVLMAFKARHIEGTALKCFSWLLLQLVSLPSEEANSFRAEAGEDGIVDKILASTDPDTKSNGYKIQHILRTRNSDLSSNNRYSPGGRHDNDFEDFRQIALLPTADELLCKEPAFILTTDEQSRVPEEKLLATHLDNQFRLNREDLLYELREEVQVILGIKKGNHRGLVVNDLKLLDELYRKPDTKNCNLWGIQLKCDADFWFYRKEKLVHMNARKKFISDERNRRHLKHQSLVCLLVDGEIAAFPTINRDEDLLARKPPIIVLQLDDQSTSRALSMLFKGGDISVIQIDTAFFAHEHILKRLQEMTSLPLSHEILNWNQDSVFEEPSGAPLQIINALQTYPTQDLKPLLCLKRSIILDNAQSQSLLSGLKQRVSLIQGPPGTGKSFIGALIAKILHDSTSHTILVCCYTNHALDQFLEDLMDIGIPQSSIVRLGGKATARTEMLAISKQSRVSKFNRNDHRHLDMLRLNADGCFERLTNLYSEAKTKNIQYSALLEYLEFEENQYYLAFQVPQDNLKDGMEVIGRRGKAVNSTYLLREWLNGNGPGIFKKRPNVVAAKEIWMRPLLFRKQELERWKINILKEDINNISEMAERYNSYQYQIGEKYLESDGAILRNKRIIGCTTTAAAKYSSTLSSASPDVLLVEEAGEILESHILTALGQRAKQLVLIGDHKQLRPKVNNYTLTVERGDGYDLNRSLFERLVLRGYPHTVLNKQHRMRPEISSLIRHLMYPDLIDADSTENRGNIRGFRDNLIFINHDKPEDEMPKVAELRDLGSKSSKQNTHEVNMILKIVRYLGQQGYGTDKLVILTPYLGQLYKFMDALKNENDPILNDLDSFDLVRAGLLPASVAKLQKKRIRIATIDNYQGEESDIVIVSLTRSNSSNDIGFMSSPQRLNVLLSRARDALIMIGNAQTFINSRKGGDIWTKLFELLKRNGHMYEGLPVKCERHKDRITLLKMPSDFDLETPDGGCKEPCQSLLSCGLHTCPSKCHQLYDHSKMECKHIVKNSCPNGHNQDYACYEGLPASCKKCESEAKIAEDKRREALELRRRRDAEEQEHLRQIAEIEAEIALERQKVADARLEEQRKNSIAQKTQDLKDVRSRVTDVCKTLFNNTISSLVGTSTEQTTATANTTQQGLTSERISAGHISPPAKVATSSPSQVEWSRQKEVDGASNDHLDQIMEMIGLEAVKAKVLDIKDRVEVSKRQNVPLTSERFNAVFLGNPGTGKTTVARHFAKFLSSVEVIPTDTFIETSGSRLASDGILGAKKMIEDILKAGGGAIFVDEAYQLTSGSNYGGGQVLDFLLAEMENNVGKIVFILAGYSEPMEKFFEHNVGLTSRVPHQLVFSDYSDEELLNMLENKVSKKWKGEMQVDDGMRGLYSRIAIRRLGRGRGKVGFGNARALENLLSSICDRQARRLRKQRRDGQTPSDFLIVKEDLIGPDPSDAILGSAAWEKLNKMIGLKAVKSSIQAMFQMIKENYHRELHEKEPMLVSLNRVFLGNPGTGKTTVAKLYGQILVDIGLLSNGEVIIKNPADFVGSVLGESEQKTKAILANTVGKVLVIDEAYMLYGGSSNGSNNNDIYKTAVIDTIVAEVQGVPGDDRCVLMLGYEPQMRDMFQSVNPGLSRRFAIEDAFRFEDYSDSELMEILDLKLKQQDLHATDTAKVTAIRILSMARNRPNFGNGGEVENMLTKAKGLYQSRIAHLPPAQRSVDVTFEPQDFDPQFDRVNRSSENLDKLFQDVIGCDKIKEKLKDYQKIASSMTLESAKELIPTNFIFKGPPGTGKTTTARKMGDVYYDMGFLSSSEVMECSASDLVGQFVGHTGPKTKKIFEKALGRVLFIDEAYRLGEGQFAKEAIDEVVGILTSETFASKLIVILAGYDEDMNKLLAVNSGLSSRFPEEFIFENMSPAHSLAILKGELKRHDVYVHSLDDPNSTDGAEVLRLLKELSNLPSWGNARDIKTLGKTMIRTAAVKDRQPKQEDGEDFRIELKAEDALACLLTMLKDRKARSIDVRTFSDTAPSIQNLMQQLSTSPPPPTPAVVIGHNTGTRASSDNRDSEIKSPAVDGEMSRDAGVSDETWNELRRDKLLAAEDAKRRDEELQRLQSELIEKQNIEDAKKAEAHELELAKQRAKDFAAIEELKRKQEEIRLREVQAALERQRIEEELEEKRKREAERRAAEVKVQQKLRTMGVCPAGFNWTKQANGYRCAGGSHFVTDGQLGL